jgi:CubicO group peptidase (beta-lactamase class C family)
MNTKPTNPGVDQIFAQYKEPDSPGCALAVMKDGEILFKQGYGLADLENKLPNLPSTVFSIGSTAKQFTAFTIALLEDQGKLSFEDDIRRYLPEMHEFDSKITIRNLIHHTSGIRCTFPELLGLAEWRESDVVTQEDVFRLLQKQRDLDFPTGTEFAYANSNYILLALICERISSKSFASFCKEHIFDPLGMNSTVINDQFWKIIPGRARAYYRDDSVGWSNSLLADAVIGSTNVYSTVEDIALWDENFYTGQICGMSVVKKMHQPGHLNDGTTLDYAFGLEVGPTHRHRGWQLVEHGGGHGGYCSHMVRFPDLHLSVLVLFNHFLWGSRDFALRVADQFIEDHPDLDESKETLQRAAAGIELADEQLAAKAGKYFNSRRVALREITFIEGGLKYEELDLVPLSENRFYFEEVPEVKVEFIATDDGVPQRIKTFTSSGVYTYDYVEVVDLDSDELINYEGRFYSGELDLYWTVSRKEDHLVISRRKYVDSILTELFTDAFSDDWTSIVGYPLKFMVIFERDGQGKITGLNVSGDRVRNLRFNSSHDV